MALVPAKCTECGASIEVDASKEAGICSYCGTAFITEKVINNYNFNTTHNVTNNITKIINGKEKDEGDDYFNRGLTNLKLKKYDAARKNFDKAILKNPEIAKYYFYWTYAASYGLQDYNVFFKEIAPPFWRNEEEEENNSIDSFFALATNEEKQQLTNEYGIDLTNGEANLRIYLLNKAFEEKTFFEKFNISSYSYEKLLNNLTDEEKESIKDNAYKFLQNNTNPKALDLLTTHIEYNIYPNSDKLMQYKSNKEVLKTILTSPDIDGSISSYEEVVNKKLEELKRVEEEKLKADKAKKKQEEYENNMGKCGSYSGIAAVVVFVIAYFAIAYRIHETGEGNIVTTPFWPAVGIGIVGAIVVYLVMFLFYKIKEKKDK